MKEVLLKDGALYAQDQLSEHRYKINSDEGGSVLND